MLCAVLRIVATSVVTQAMTAEVIEGVSGQYFADGKQIQPSATAQDNELAERLCTATSQLLQGGSSAKSVDYRSTVAATNNPSE